jgi:hypothetical protein
MNTTNARRLVLSNGLVASVRENYLLSMVSKYYVPYQSDGRIGLSAA